MIERSRGTFERWARGLGRAMADPSGWDERAAWLRAGRTIAARVALAAVRERLCDGGVSGDALVLGNGAALPLRRRGSFELHQPDLDAPCDPRLHDPLRLWSELAGGLAPAQRERIAIELADSAFNLGLAILAERARPELARRCPDDPRGLDPEHWVTEGHPWHPMSKTRLGLGLAEHARLAPELLADTTLRTVDVVEALVRATPEFVERLEPWLGRPAPGWVRLPVHGAQLRRLARSFAGRWGRELQPTPWRGRARSLLSLRTVAVDAAPGGPLHLKLALDMHTTSARRVVSAMSVANGPRVSALLAAIATADPWCAPLRVVAETMTAGLRADVVGADAHELGVIVRDGSEFHDDQGRRAWVCAGLGSPSPIDGRPGVVRLAEGFPGPPVARARAMLAIYLDALVPPVLRFALHGVALEAHLQNTLVLVRTGRPVGFVVRDLGGIRLHGPRLAAAGHRVSLHPGSFIVTDDLAELQGKVGHTLLHAHLTSLLGWVEDHLGLPVAEGWGLVRRCITTHLQRWANEPARREACEADLAVYLAPRVRAKALLRMRIDDRSSEYAYVDVDNPLATAISPPA